MKQLLPILLSGFILASTLFLSLVQPTPDIPQNYMDFLNRLHLYVYDTEKDYPFPENAEILAEIKPGKGSMMVHVGWEDLMERERFQYNDLYFNLELGDDGKFWLEGRFTGGYRKTLWFDRPTKGRFEISTYFDRVWFTCNYDPRTEEFEFGEYW